MLGPMGLTVQKVAAAEDEAAARMRMKASYSQRMLIQTLWAGNLNEPLFCWQVLLWQGQASACRNHWKKKIVYFRKYEKNK